MFFKKSIVCLAIAAMTLGNVACAPKVITPMPTVTTPPAKLSTQTVLPSPTQGKQPIIPSNIELDAFGEPILKVYVVKKELVERMPIEEYLCGVLAGEMKNDWPMEALKAQAIIARTFALKFIEDKGASQYPGADLSTDVQEAQAYDEEGINQRVRQAIEETRGQVITYDGELTYAWFHAHAGGITAAAKEGLEWEGEEPAYIQSVKSTESDMAPKDDTQWTATFPMEQVKATLAEMGFTFTTIKDISIGQQGPSGRTLTFDIEGTQVTAPSLRIRLDPKVFKSTLLTSVAIVDNSLVLKGKGYGHGVGMSQWGAYYLAEQGSSANQIIKSYYTGVSIQPLW